jgi:nickel-type superoxide dismutase maturation protease
MFYLRRVVGESMHPTLRENQLILVSRARDFKVGDVVVAFMNSREVIKRIDKYTEGQVFLVGDNKEQSSDSRTYGWLVDSHIEGKIIWPRISTKS